MKKAAIVLSVLLLVESLQLSAEGAKIKTLTQIEKEQIAWAINILMATGTLKVDENKCTKFDSEIIKQLKEAGLFKEDDSRLMSICVDMGN